MRNAGLYIIKLIVQCIASKIQIGNKYRSPIRMCAASLVSSNKRNIWYHLQRSACFQKTPSRHKTILKMELRWVRDNICSILADFFQRYIRDNYFNLVNFYFIPAEPSHWGIPRRSKWKVKMCSLQLLNKFNIYQTLIWGPSCWSRWHSRFLTYDVSYDRSTFVTKSRSSRWSHWALCQVCCCKDLLFSHKLIGQEPARWDARSLLIYFQ